MPIRGGNIPFSCRLIQQVSVLDPLDSIIDSVVDRLCSVGMSGTLDISFSIITKGKTHHLLAHLPRGRSDRPDLVRRVLDRVDRVRLTRYTSTQHDLDKVRPLLQLLPYRLETRRYAVRRTTISCVVSSAAARAVSAGLAREKVAVPAGLGKRLAALEQPGTLDEPFRDGIGDELGSAAGVADGSEATLEHALEDIGGAEGDDLRVETDHISHGLIVSSVNARGRQNLQQHQVQRRHAHAHQSIQDR